jgi:hypothetical protein
LKRAAYGCFRNPAIDVGIGFPEIKRGKRIKRGSAYEK